jgi:zinc protease
MMRTIQHRFYVPNNMALVVAGDVKAEDVFAKAEKIYGSWKRGADPFPTYNPPAFPPIEKQLVVREATGVPYSYIDMTWQGPSLTKDDPDTYAADVFFTMLGQPNSRLQKNLVEKRLAYQIQPSYFSQKNVGPISVVMFAPAPRTKDAIAALKSEIANWNAQDYFTDDELATAKRSIEGDRIYEQESGTDYATRSVPFWWASHSLDYYTHYIDNVKRVSRADIQRFLDRWIKNKNYVLGVAANKVALDKLNLKPEEVLQ